MSEKEGGLPPRPIDILVSEINQALVRYQRHNQGMEWVDVGCCLGRFNTWLINAAFQEKGETFAEMVRSHLEPIPGYTENDKSPGLAAQQVKKNVH